LKKIRWGILGTGRIARAFVQALKTLPDAELLAVGSREQATADKFAKEFDIPRAYPSYDQLASDPDIEVIYISTPHNLHAENTLTCMKSGKAVLCEKPLTVNAKEASEVIQFAREKKLFLMEAMWSRCLPTYRKVREWILEGKIGEVRMLSADFGFNPGWKPEDRTLNPDLAGGALLDVGIYPVSLAFWVFGKRPERISSMAHIGSTGVDEQNAMIFGYDKGRIAVLSSACQTNTQKEAFIAGTEGYIKLFSPFWRSQKALVFKDEKEEIYDIPYDGNGFPHEAVEVMNCLRAGKLESKIMPLDESLVIMETMDSLRKEWGLKYPFENK
jgi:dihydrodiol dehydrogenase / D-xylose 1-dehydrogenase (NADP)